MRDAERALVEVGLLLRASGYRFVTPTPRTHEVVLRRGAALIAANLRDLFGWSLPARAELLPSALREALREADAVEVRGDLWYPRIRVSSLGDGLFLHSAYPTASADAVFFGPDTYRFCGLLAREVETARRIVDVGAGSGAGGLSLARRAERIVLADVNPRALAFARVNAVLAGVAERVEVVASDVLDGIEDPFDLVISNPPYLVDDAARAYRHGGDGLGTALSVRIVSAALARLAPDGRLVVYTGAPVVAGEDLFRNAVVPLLEARGARWAYVELDPDVFGEELERPAYAEVERIAVVALTAAVP